MLCLERAPMDRGLKTTRVNGDNPDSGLLSVHGRYPNTKQLSMSIKNTLIEFIQSRLAARGLRIARVPFPEDHQFSVLEFLSDRLPQTGTDFFVVQIGANDGCTEDMLCELIKSRGWKALLVEPQPGPFATLQATYRDYPNVQCVQCAVAHEDGEATLWCVDGEGTTTQLASFSRAVLAKHSRHVPDIKAFPDPGNESTEPEALNPARSPRDIACGSVAGRHGRLRLRDPQDALRH